MKLFLKKKKPCPLKTDLWLHKNIRNFLSVFFSYRWNFNLTAALLQHNRFQYFFQTNVQLVKEVYLWCKLYKVRFTVEQ